MNEPATPPPIRPEDIVSPAEVLLQLAEWIELHDQQMRAGDDRNIKAFREFDTLATAKKYQLLRLDAGQLRALAAGQDREPRPQVVPEGRAATEDALVTAIASAMRVKLARAREKGRGGWDDPADCSITHLHDCLVEHVVKPNLDMVDVANIAAMIWTRLETYPEERAPLLEYVQAQRTPGPDHER